jgi:hypothetical protein
MSYERLELTDFVDKWDAAKVKHLEDGIVANAEAIERYHNDSIVETQADWNQNDETAKDYIRNRPFYTAKGMGRVLLVSGELSAKDYTYKTWSTDPAYQLEIGKEYIVVCGDYEERAVGTECVGPKGRRGVSLSDGTAGSPFYCTSFEVEGGYDFYFVATWKNHFAIYHEVEMDIDVTLPEQYLPQNLVKKIKAIPDYS